jgi:hypothetical protein
VVVPDDLTDGWEIVRHGLRRKDWDCTITFATYPPPLCFEAARQYEAKAIEMQAKRAELAEKRKGKKPKKAKPPPPKEQLELW